MASILKVDTIQDQDGNNIINESGDTITIGASGDTINVVGTLQNNGNNAVGITEADQWRLTANTNSGTDADVTTNWERVDTDGWGNIGTGLTESSGIFSFPTTGIYLINFIARMGVASSENSANLILYTTLNNSTYDIASYATCGNPDASNTVTCSGSNHQLFDVTDITTHKFKFVTSSFNVGTVLTGNTSDTRTGFTCIRLGDT
jgi:hypothetical protein